MSTKSDLRNLQNELYSIIQELKSIASAMQTESQGVYMESYGAKVREIATEYTRYYNILRNARVIEKD